MHAVNNLSTCTDRGAGWSRDTHGTTPTYERSNAQARPRDEPGADLTRHMRIRCPGFSLVPMEPTCESLETSDRRRPRASARCYVSHRRDSRTNTSKPLKPSLSASVASPLSPCAHPHRLKPSAGRRPQRCFRSRPRACTCWVTVRVQRPPCCCRLWSRPASRASSLPLRSRRLSQLFRPHARHWRCRCYRCSKRQ